MPPCKRRAAATVLAPFEPHEMPQKPHHPQHLDGSDKNDMALKIAEETLDDVIRNPSIQVFLANEARCGARRVPDPQARAQAREKLRRIVCACNSNDGWLVATALHGNGWNNRTLHPPPWL